MDKLIETDNAKHILTYLEEFHNDGLLKFKTITEETFSKLLVRQKHIDDKMIAFGKSTTQTEASLFNLTMMDETPLRRIRQCCAQLEKKKLALFENYYKLKKDLLDIDVLLNQDTDLSEIEVKEKRFKISNSTKYIEACIKEIYHYQNIYTQLVETYGYDSWDEHDFEKAELEHHLISVFKQGLRDVISHGRLSSSTQQYLEQLCIEPVSILSRFDASLKQLQNETTTELRETIIQKFVDEFNTTSHLNVIKQSLGLTTIITEEVIHKENH